MSATAALGAAPRSRARLARNPRIVAGLGILVLLMLVCAVGPALLGISPEATDGTALGLAPGTPGHLLGTDALGHDLTARVLAGGRTSLLIGAAVAAIALTIGIAVGIAAGVGPSWVDTTLMRLIDTVLTLPFLVFLLALRSILPASATTVILVIAAFTWMGVARVVRTQLLSLREQDYIRAAVSLGTSRRRIITRHLLPNALAPVLASASWLVAEAIVAESTLSFLGLGVPPSQPTWGNTLTDAQQGVLIGQWWVLAWPALGIFLVVLAVNILAGGIGGTHAGWRRTRLRAMAPDERWHRAL